MACAVVASAGGGQAVDFLVRRHYFILEVSRIKNAVVAQLVEHVIGNDEVAGSIPANGFAVEYANCFAYDRD